MDDFGPIAQAVAQSGAQILPVCGEFSSDKGFAATPILQTAVAWAEWVA